MVANHLRLHACGINTEMFAEMHAKAQAVEIRSRTQHAVVPGCFASNVGKRIGRIGDRDQLERDVRYANITIIEGHDASQYGIGIVSARIAEIVLRDERAAIPIGSYHHEFGVTLSLPSIVGHTGVLEVMRPELSPLESSALEGSAEGLRNALRRVGN